MQAALNGRPYPYIGGPAHIRWAAASINSRHEVLVHAAEPVTAVATTALPDPSTPYDRPIAVTGSYDGTVRIWDLTAGAPIGDPLTGHTNRVTAVACSQLPDGRPIAVTGSWDDTVRVWDLTDGTPIGDPSPATPAACTRSPAAGCRTAGPSPSPAAERSG